MGSRTGNRPKPPSVKELARKHDELKQQSLRVPVARRQLAEQLLRHYKEQLDNLPHAKQPKNTAFRLKNLSVSLPPIFEHLKTSPRPLLGLSDLSESLQESGQFGPAKTVNVVRESIVRPIKRSNLARNQKRRRVKRGFTY